MNPSLKQAKLALNFEGYIGDFQMIFWNAGMVKIFNGLVSVGMRGNMFNNIFALFRRVHNADKG